MSSIRGIATSRPEEVCRLLSLGAKHVAGSRLAGDHRSARACILRGCSVSVTQHHIACRPCARTCKEQACRNVQGTLMSELL